MLIRVYYDRVEVTSPRIPSVFASELRSPKAGGLHVSDAEFCIVLFGASLPGAGVQVLEYWEPRRHNLECWNSATWLMIR